MPSEKILLEKKEIVEELKDKLSGSISGVLVDYKGISVLNDTKLRKELREAGVEYAVVKNTLLRLAARDTGLNELEAYLEGTTALAVSRTDPAVAARILCKYADASKGKFSIKAGFVEGRALDVDGVRALSKLPSREVLIAQVLAGFNSPIAGFVNVLNGNIRGLAVALNAIAEKKSA